MRKPRMPDPGPPAARPATAAQFSGDSSLIGGGLPSGANFFTERTGSDNRLTAFFSKVQAKRGGRPSLLGGGE